jgi:hypothetical protein
MLNGTERSRIVDFAAVHRLPAVFESIQSARRGDGLFG